MMTEEESVEDERTTRKEDRIRTAAYDLTLFSTCNPLIGVK